MHSRNAAIRFICVLLLFTVSCRATKAPENSTPATPAVTPSLVEEATTASVPQLLATPTPKAEDSASLAAGRIAFVGKDGQLWLTTPAGQPQGPLTAEGEAQSPAWSPDGKTLAYIQQVDEQNRGQVMLYNLDTERSTALLELPEHAGALEWSPDGRHLLLDSGTGAVRQLAVVAVASGEVLYETSALGYAWSPDGLHLALGLRQPLDTPISLETGDSVSLAILVLEAREMQVVFAGTSERLYFPRAWLPDGRLFFEQLDWDERLQTGDDSRWTMHYITGRIGEPQPAQDIPTAFDREAILARLPEEFRSASTHSFSWSSDGQCMVFQSGNSIYLFDWSSGGEPRFLADGTSPVWQPSSLTSSAQDCLLTDIPLIREMLWSLETFAWSPTEDALVYVGPDREEDTPLTGTLMMMRFAPHIDTPQVLAPNVVGDPTWSPDGSRIAFVVLRPTDQLGTIMVIDADGSNLLDLLPGDKARTDPGAGYKAIEGWWDEDQIVVSTNCGAGCRRPMVLDLQRQTLEPLLFSGQEGSGYAWSSDRASVVVIGGANPQIGAISQNEEEVSWFSGHGSLDTSLASFWTFFVGWSPDSSHLLFLRQPNDRSGPPELWVWNRDTRAMSALLTSVITARWSPQGYQIAFLAQGQPHLASDESFADVTPDPQDSNALVVGLYQYFEGGVVTLFEGGTVDAGINFIEELAQTPVLEWSPNGEQLVYFDEAGHARFLSMNESSPHEIPIRGYPPDEVSWSYDGKKLAVQASGYARIFAVPCSSQ